MNRHLRWLLCALLLFGLPAAGSVWAQQPEEDADFEEMDELLDEDLDDIEGEFDDSLDSDEDLLGEDEFSDGGEDPEDLEYIDDLLEGDEEILEDTGFSYDDGNRRDPFQSLLVDRQPVGPDLRPRPEGIPGMLIDEVRVSGVWITESGPVAQVQAANQAKSYLIRPGDQLFDGDVLRITYERYAGAEVVFKQMVNDPTAPKPFREVVKRLEP